MIVVVTEHEDEALALGQLLHGEIERIAPFARHELGLGRAIGRPRGALDGVLIATTGVANRQQPARAARRAFCRSRQPLIRTRVNQTSNDRCRWNEAMWVYALTKASCTASSASATSRR
jgi:hypothetical protein